MNEKELAKYLYNRVIKDKNEIGEQFVASGIKLTQEPFTDIKDIDLFFKECKSLGLIIEYAQDSIYKKEYKKDNYQTIIAFLSNDTL